MNLSPEFSKFNLYPYPVLIMDENGFVVYKNNSVSKLYPNVRIGAKMSNYTDINFSQGINRQNFYGENCVLFTSLENGLTLIFVILPFSTSFFDFENVDLNSEIEKSLLEYNGSLDEKSQKSYLKTYLLNIEKVKKFGEFAINFANNNLINENINSSVALQEIIDVIANRLLDNVTIKLCVESHKTNLYTDRKSFIITILSTLYFCIASSNTGNIKITLSDNDKDLHILFEITSGCDFNKLAGNNSNFLENPYMLTLNTAFQFISDSSTDFNIKTTSSKNAFCHHFEYIFKNCSYPELSMSGKAIIAQDTEVFAKTLASLFSE